MWAVYHNEAHSAFWKGDRCYHQPTTQSHFFFLKKTLFLEREKGGRKRGRETLISCLSYMPLAGTDNLGLYPDQESNQHPFTLQNNAQPTEPHRSGLSNYTFEG